VAVHVYEGTRPIQSPCRRKSKLRTRFGITELGLRRRPRHGQGQRHARTATAGFRYITR